MKTPNTDACTQTNSWFQASSLHSLYCSWLGYVRTLQKKEVGVLFLLCTDPCLSKKKTKLLQYPLLQKEQEEVAFSHVQVPACRDALRKKAVSYQEAVRRVASPVFLPGQCHPSGSCYISQASSIAYNSLSQKCDALHWAIQIPRAFYQGTRRCASSQWRVCSWFSQSRAPSLLMQSFLINAYAPLPRIGLAPSAEGMCLWLCCALVIIIIPSIFLVCSIAGAGQLL